MNRGVNVQTEGGVIRLLAAVLVRRGGTATDVNIVRKSFYFFLLLFIVFFCVCVCVRHWSQSLLLPLSFVLTLISCGWLHEVVHQAGMGSTVLTIVSVWMEGHVIQHRENVTAQKGGPEEIVVKVCNVLLLPADWLKYCWRSMTTWAVYN